MSGVNEGAGRWLNRQCLGFSRRQGTGQTAIRCQAGERNDIPSVSEAVSVPKINEQSASN